MGLYILIIGGHLKKIDDFVVCDIWVLDFNYGEERLPVRVGQIKIYLDCAFGKPIV